MFAPSGSRQQPSDPTENPLSGPDEETPSTQAPAAAATTPTPAPAPASPPPTLDGAQRRHLRGLAHPLKPIVFVGEGGVSDAVAAMLVRANVNAYSVVTFQREINIIRLNTCI